MIRKILAIALLASMLAGCGATLEPIKGMDTNRNYTVVKHARGGWAVPARTVISDDKQTLFISHKKIGLENILLGAAFTHLTEQNKTSDSLKKIKQEVSIDLHGLMVDELNQRGLGIAGNNGTVELTPYNWIFLDEDQTARLLTVLEIEYGVGEEKTWTRVIRISPIRKQLKGERGWVTVRNNSVEMETKKNISEIMDYVIKSLNDEVKLTNGENREINDGVISKMFSPPPYGSIFHESYGKVYVLIAGGPQLFTSGVVIYNKGEI